MGCDLYFTENIGESIMACLSQQSGLVDQETLGINGLYCLSVMEIDMHSQLQVDLSFRSAVSNFAYLLKYRNLENEVY